MARDRGTAWSLSHRDERREMTITSGAQTERRDRVKTALACLLNDDHPDDLLDALGIPDDEVGLARTVQQRLQAAG